MSERAGGREGPRLTVLRRNLLEIRKGSLEHSCSRLTVRPCFNCFSSLHSSQGMIVKFLCALSLVLGWAVFYGYPLYVSFVDDLERIKTPTMMDTPTILNIL